ncbi:clathrin heavy chain linker domain-containing protein 1-like [Elysia marginata]|uniref:Clathrin heavy chain linker domain-containing protein 1-like n=1 Tax=Elysia marginata TaxID=1093978 RepID=A0AAV4FN96_9GAST|nr:clathrin heavy chain linker domain-containing protein 1-like [Elysia marginata]
MSSRSSRSSSATPTPSYYKLPPIITTESDRIFLNDVNTFIESELSKINQLDEEQRYLVYKAVFNKVIDHVTAYKPILTLIKKEYEDTIETIKKGQREANFLQGKLKAMASEPSTLRNYKKRADELEERIFMVKKENDTLQSELVEIQAIREEREKRPKTAETPKRQLKKDNRLIPGLTLEETTDMKILQKKFDALDRQLKELNISLKARFLPKSHKLQLKEGLDEKVAYRDKLLWQSQVYKTRGQKLKIALEAAQAYNQMRPPHQTVGDAVTIAFHQASGALRAEIEKADGEQSEATHASFEDDDPNKEKEAEMMLEYIERFNELFEDGHFEQAAVHAANSPKGILRTQATLAKFRDVKSTASGRSPLLAFCDALMSSVKAAGNKPNEALSMDCIGASLRENRLELAYHWLSQDRLTLSHGLGRMIAEHCSCPVPCRCGCQALAQAVFVRLKAHDDVLVSMLRQGKMQGALQYSKLWFCINSENMSELLAISPCQQFVDGLMESENRGKKPILSVSLAKLLEALIGLDLPDLIANLIRKMLCSDQENKGRAFPILSLQRAVVLDRDSVTSQRWTSIVEYLGSHGQEEMGLRLLAMTTVVDTLYLAWATVYEDKKVSFSSEIQSKGDSNAQAQDDGDDENDSSDGMSSRSRGSTSMDHSSRETSPEVSMRHKGNKSPAASILKKQSQPPEDDAASSSPNNASATKVKKGVRLGGIQSPTTASANDAENAESFSTSTPRAKGKGGNVIKFMNNDPYTSNPESDDESQA